MNPLSSRKRTSSSRSILVIFNYWIFWTFLVEQQALIHFWSYTKLLKRKHFYPIDGLITLTKCRIQNFQFPPYDAFYSKLRSCNAFLAEYTDYVNLLKSGLTTEHAVVKLKLLIPPPTGIENYQNLNRYGSRNNWAQSKNFAVQ